LEKSSTKKRDQVGFGGDGLQDQLRRIFFKRKRGVIGSITAGEDFLGGGRV